MREKARLASYTCAQLGIFSPDGTRLKGRHLLFAKCRRSSARSKTGPCIPAPTFAGSGIYFLGFSICGYTPPKVLGRLNCMWK